MIKQYWEITIRDFDVMERTGSVAHLRRSWNVLPTFLFIRRIRRCLDALMKEIDVKEREEDAIFNSRWQVESLNKLNGLRVAYLGLESSLKLRVVMQNLVMSYLLRNKRIRVKEGTNLDKFVDLAYKYSGIEVKTYKDVEKLRNTIQFRTDKYAENFTRKQKIKDNQEKTYLMSIALGVFSYLNLGFNPDITVIEFVEARNKAEQQITKEKRDGRS